MKLTKEDLTELAVTIYDEMIRGSTESEIMDVLGIDSETFQRARRFMLEQRADSIRGKKREHVYVEYVIEQTGNILRLDRLLSGLDDKKQYNAVVGAVRLRSDILDKIIARGQEFGIIRKEPQRKELVAGILVAEMSDVDLKKAVMGQINTLNKMVGEYGDVDIMALPESPTHYGPKVSLGGSSVEGGSKAAKPTKTARSKTSRRHAGRRRVKEES